MKSGCYDSQMSDSHSEPVVSLDPALREASPSSGISELPRAEQTRAEHPEAPAASMTSEPLTPAEPVLFYRSGLPATPGQKAPVETDPSQKDLAQPPRVLRKLEKRLRRLCGKAVVDYNMIEEGDRIMVCLSGGKDSYTLLEMLRHLQVVAPINFTLTAVNLDQKQPGFPEHILPGYLQALGVDYKVIERDTYSVVKRVIPEGGTTCGLCSRLRRGTLYGFAEEHGFTKIALGHHRDDIVETLFLNLFHGGKLQAMPPKLKSDDGRNIVIRPLAYVPEHLIEDYAERKQFPIIPCDLCGSQPNLQRATIKAMLRQWEAENPGRTESIFSAICDVRPSQLADKSLFDFASLALQRQ